MTLEQFFSVRHQQDGVFELKHDTIKSNKSEWQWYYYGTLIAEYSNKSVKLYELGYSKSTTRRHNIVRRFYSV